MALSPLFRPVSFDALPGWRHDDKMAAFDALRRSAQHVLGKPYKTGALGVDFAAFAQAYEASRRLQPAGPAEAHAFFEQYFVPVHVQPEARRTRLRHRLLRA